MAPLTRNRACPARCPATLHGRATTAQRASAGLIVTEATQICAEGQGYLDTPGIYSAEQVAGWRRVTDAVHAAGGRIVVQLWHVGRISHVSLQPDGQAPVSSTRDGAPRPRPSRARASRTCRRRARCAPTSCRASSPTTATPRAARCEAGFDGVEVHGANGYLLEQFLRDSINDRSDAYGGSIENRARLLLEVMQAVVDEIGAGRTGLRLSPVTPANDAAQDSDAAGAVRPRRRAAGADEAGLPAR